MLNRNITAVMNLIAKMGLDEQTFMLMVANMSFEDAINVLMEKGDIPTEEDYRTEDLPSKDEAVYNDEDDAYLESWATYANAIQESRVAHKMMVLKAKKGHNHTTKAHRKDKAKAGLHRGSKREGWGHYDRWLKPETLARDVKRDLKAQMEEVNKAEDINLNEVKQDLHMVFNMDLNGMNKVYYHYAEEFAFLSEWNATVRSWMEKHLQDMPGEGDVYSYMEENYPTMSMSTMKNIVEGFVSEYRMAILMETGNMWRYCQNSYRDYRESMVLDLHEEYRRLEDLTKEVKMGRSVDVADKEVEFTIVLAGIKTIKEQLEEMDKENKKFI